MRLVTYNKFAEPDNKMDIGIATDMHWYHIPVVGREQFQISSRVLQPKTHYSEEADGTSCIQ